MQVAALNLSTVYWAEDNEMAKKNFAADISGQHKDFVVHPHCKCIPCNENRISLYPNFYIEIHCREFCLCYSIPPQHLFLAILI